MKTILKYTIYFYIFVLWSILYQLMSMVTSKKSIITAECMNKEQEHG